MSDTTDDMEMAEAALCCIKCDEHHTECECDDGEFEISEPDFF
jgi:hypothetical protein